MTPEERARPVVEKIHRLGYVDDAMEYSIAEAIRAAVEEEREACAALCDELFSRAPLCGDESSWAATDCAEAIRQRKT